MTQPLETLEKILHLEEEDYQYQDKAVSGGLARYAETWRKQAGRQYGEAAEPWVEEIARRLESYSTLDVGSRPAAMRALWEILRAGPQGTPPVRPTEAPAPPPPTEPKPAPPPTPSRPQAGRGLDAPVTTLPGVGKKHGQLLAKIGVETIRDLLYLYPRRHEDYSQFKTIDRLQYGERTSVIATVWEAGGRETRSGKYLFRAILSDHTGTLEVTWFNRRYLEGRIRPGMQIVVSGKVDRYLGRLTMNSPEWEPVGRKELTHARIQPVYPLTEGLTQRWMRQTMQRALNLWAARVPDVLPESLREAHHLPKLSRALWGIHLPDSQTHLAEAKRRLAFEEALYLQLGLLQQKRHWQSQPGRAIAVPDERLEALRAALPYTLTGAQERSLAEMIQDITQPRPMNRLLQGDVGSGKTVVAAILMALVAADGHQAAMMAPTELLAEQHYRSLNKLFAAFPETLRPSLDLLTGSVSGSKRQTIYEGLADGSLQILVGTHALIQQTVQFKSLALAVIDEQHRFGVAQRGALRQKGYNPHLLVMTATPIPRSLELTIWGHLDVSVLDEMPPGRRPVKTRVLYPRERERAYAFIRHQVQQGRQAFIIYPLVEASEKVEARAAVDEYERLQREIFPDLRLGLLHGRMRADEKENVMAQFAQGDLDILVATSVVEVGIDVPNATVILIDGAERFGLAQLHQFRGRVGRGEHQSYCLLLSENPSEEAMERLRAVEATTDGFALAEKDLEMRGPGEFLGTRQSGFPAMPLAMTADTRLLHEVREAAARLLERDPELTLPEHQELARRVAEFWSTEADLS